MAKYINLTRGQRTLVDDEDYIKLSSISWYCSNTGYAQRTNEERRPVLLHRVIMGYMGKQIDHINGDKLDNRRSNLRVCDAMENQQNSKRRIDNTSGYKGVGWSKVANKWVGGITFHGKRYNLGYFNDPKEAAMEYDNAAEQLFGIFARLNFERKY